MSDPGNFLSRWSRRKSEQQRDARRDKERAAVPPSAPDAAPGQDDAAARPAVPRATAAELPAFDPASLPPLESIGANTDVRAFLQPGVPADLRNAALRRAWSVDPAIRDFKGLQENDWDFNDPNGIPGFGPLSPGLDVKKMASALFGDAPKDERIDDSAKGGGQAAAAMQKSADGDVSHAPSAESAGKNNSVSADNPHTHDDLVQREENFASQNMNSESESVAVKRRRPRGGALPQI